MIRALPVVVLGCLCASIVHAEEAGVPIGFSNLVFRLDEGDEIGIAAANFRVLILETLRAQGFNAVGAESLVFGRDEGAQAQVLLGGTVREMRCQECLPDSRRQLVRAVEPSHLR